MEPARPRLLSLIDEEQPDNLCVRIGVDRLLADAQLALNPIAILLDSERLPLKPISFTEWQHATSSPRFATVLALPGADAEVLSSALHVQIRHVHDAFWDDKGPTAKAMQAMPLLGKCSFTLAEAHSACAAGEPLTLELMRPPDLERTLSPASGAGARAATPAAVVHLTFARPADGEPWSRAETLSLAHSTVNYCFPGGPSAAAAAASVFAPPSTPRRGTQTKELQVSEHMLCCACGYAVPRAVLRMLRDDARRHATPPLEMDSSKLKLDDSNGSSSPEMSRRDEADPSRLLACLSPDGWRRHLNWLEQSLAQLHGAFQHEHGFKQSTMKTSVPLAPMAINLHLNVLDVVEADGAAPSKTPLCRSLHATISTGAFAAHNLGFSDGGAAEHETRLLQLLSHGPNSPMRSSVIYHPPTVSGSADALALPYAIRISILMCQAYSALAASFSACCRLHLAASDDGWFLQLVSVGFLIHMESLLTTRGEEWGMLQDVHVACKLLTRVQIAIRDDNDDGASNGPFSPAGATSATSSSPGDSTHGGSAANTKDGSHGWSGVAHGVRVSGTRRHPVLELSPHDLGFLDREHARSMGWRHGLRLPVHAVLFTQGINEDQSMANLMRTHTADQQAMNAVAVRGLRTYATAVSDHLHDMRNNSLHTNLKSVRERAHKAVVAVSAAPEADNDEFTLATSFIESPFSTRAEYEAALKLPHEERVKVERAAAAQRNTLATVSSPPPKPTPSDISDPLTTPSFAPPPSFAVRPSTPVSAPLLHELTAGHSSSTAPFTFTPGGAPPRPPMERAARLARLEALLHELSTLVRQSAESKNTALLEVSAEAARLLGGGRVTMCKSGKDRTSMGVTLEHGRLLQGYHGLHAAHLSEAVQAMRRRGVRRENVRLNTGKRLYAFNFLQQNFLPEAYRPPEGSAKGGKA